jgi:hypothetical protein
LATKFARSWAARFALGLALAALAQLASFFLAGAGEGWVAPFFLSVPLCVLLPVALAIAWPGGPILRGSGPMRFVLAATALGADALLISKTIDEGGALPFYVEVNGVVGFLIIGLWLGLWLFWQVMLLHALVDGQRRLDDPND